MMRKRDRYGEIVKKVTSAPHHKAIPRSKHKLNLREKALESRSKKAGFYVHGHKNFGDVYEA